MPLYSCDLCNISTKILSHHNRHLETNKHLKNQHKYDNNLEMSTNIAKMSKNEQNYGKNEHKMSKNEQNMSKNSKNSKKKYNCEYCDNLFTTHANMMRHINYYCKVVKKEKEEKENLKKMMEQQKEEFKEEKEKLYHYIDKLIDKKGNTINIDKQTNNSINLNSYGQEDISHITDNFKMKLLKGPYEMIPKMIEAVHFNDKKPENNNITLPNKKENKLKIFSGNKWIYKEKNEIIKDLIDGKYFILDTHYEEICESDENGELSNYNKNIYEKFKKLFDNKDNDLHGQIKKDCELMLLNNR